MGKKSRRKRQEKKTPDGSSSISNQQGTPGALEPGGLAYAQNILTHQNFFRNEIGQREREHHAAELKKRIKENPTENEALIVKIMDWGNNRSLEDQQKLIRTVFANCGIDWKSYDDHSDGDQSKLEGDKVDYDLAAVYRTQFDFGLSSQAAEAQTSMMRDEPDLDMFSSMVGMLGMNMDGEEIKAHSKRLMEKMDKRCNHLSRLSSYAERALPKKVEELILKKTKAGTEDRKLFVEKRDTTFRFTALMCTIFSLLHANEYALTDGYESVVQVLLKYGANPFAKDIIGRTVIHIATNTEIPKKRTPRVLKLAQMCIDASHHYDKVHKLVTLQGLSKADLNGRTGHCGGFDVTTGRLVVYLANKDGSLQAKPLAIKPENAQISTTGTAAQPSEVPKVILVDYETRISGSALYAIALDGKRDDLASFLIENNADIDAGRDGWTPRIVASNAMKSIALGTLVGDMEGRPVQGVILREIARLDKQAAKSQGGANEKESCASCGQTKKNLLKCTNCMGVLYCDRECQKAHWKHHKNECKSSGPLPLGPPTQEELEPNLVSQSIRFVEGLDLDSSSFGGYKYPSLVTLGDTFWIKISAYGKMFLLCQDETRSCCFVIYNGSRTFDSIFQFIRPDGFDGNISERNMTESRHFRAKFDEAGILLVYPKTMRIKKSF